MEEVCMKKVMEYRNKLFILFLKYVMEENFLNSLLIQDHLASHWQDIILSN